jgi:hypothetical protein
MQSLYFLAVPFCLCPFCIGEIAWMICQSEMCEEKNAPANRKSSVPPTHLTPVAEHGDLEVCQSETRWSWSRREVCGC